MSFAHKFDVVGFDINQTRVDELASGTDRTRELDSDELTAVSRLSFSTDPKSLDDVEVFQR